MTQTAITPTRNADYPEWYQQVIKAAEMAEVSAVRGCMVIRPWGYGIWECMQRKLDARFKATGHENAYFPIFIPLSFLEKEATHVEGFAKECAVVTHHRLEEKNGKLIPSGELEEPLIVRPTSETIIGASFAKWVQSYRDLPLLINQWANVVRWEMRTRLFLRTAEFLWQEGHTCHASAKEAHDETLLMLEVYRAFMEEVVALPVVTGEKPSHERFPGAVNSYSCEAMMQDRKALQAGTSHYLGQNFAKASEISFTNEAGEIEHAYTTSWGVSTRLIGAMIMAHGDDDGLKVPPRVAPKHVVIIPVVPKPELEGKVFEYGEKILSALSSTRYDDEKVVVSLDKRDIRGGDKTWAWIKKGVPIRLEAGPRDIESGSVMLYRRDKGHKEKIAVKLEELPTLVPKILEEIQNNYYSTAKEELKKHSYEDINSFEEFKKFFTPKNEDKPEIHGGFVKAWWSEAKETEEILAPLKVTIRNIPFEQSGGSGKCVLTGKPATKKAIFAKAY